MSPGDGTRDVRSLAVDSAARSDIIWTLHCSGGALKTARVGYDCAVRFYASVISRLTPDYCAYAVFLRSFSAPSFSKQLATMGEHS